MTLNQLTDNYNRLLKRIEEARRAYASFDQKILLLAVSKTQPSHFIRTLYEQGQRHFGESYLQEALIKMDSLSDLADIQWHFIGNIQSNKTSEIAQHFNWVHSIDRLKVARRLSGQRQSHQPRLNICLQVNLDREPQKRGVLPEMVTELAQSICHLPNINLRGLMAIPQKQPCFNAQIISFNRLTAMKDKLNSLKIPLDTLSMGMSNDLEAAVSAGSNLIRIGSDLFGARE